MTVITAAIQTMFCTMYMYVLCKNNFGVKGSAAK